MTRSCDVAIIGGGPAGAALGAFVAQAGHDVALFERSTFPRFHIGESLVPAVNLTLSRLGVLDALDGLGFPQKRGVQFFTEKGGSRPFYFSETKDPRLHQTWQVLRGDFDALLLENARDAGVDVSTGVRVTRVECEGDRVGAIVYRPAEATNGDEVTVSARVVVDASGQNGVLARRLGGRRLVGGLENAAIYAHYRNAKFDHGIDAGSTLIYRITKSSWLWFIPLPGRASIGLVASAREIADAEGSPTDILRAAIARSDELSQRLVDAERIGDVRVERDFSYRAQRAGGPGWLLVGDALGFMDPIYSTGLFLSLHSAELGAAAVNEALSAASHGNGTAPDFAGFAKDYELAFDRFLSLVRAFYDPDFHFGALARDAAHRLGLVDLLIGNVGSPEAIAVSAEIAALQRPRRE